MLITSRSFGDSSTIVFLHPNVCSCWCPSSSDGRRWLLLLLLRTRLPVCDVDNVTRSLSVVYEWVDDRKGQGQGRFKDIQSLEVIGARDWTHFTVDNYHFLVVASAGSQSSTSSSSSSSLSSSLHQYAVVYLWQSGRFIPFQTIEVCRCVIVVSK